MSDTTTLEELIARLEAATGPSRKLDATIDIAVNGGTAADLAYVLEDVERTLRPHRYTASIDAAMTLVPDDACWTVSVPRQPDMSGKRYWASLRSNHPGARGSTPAIALCIAALKARSQP